MPTRQGRAVVLGASMGGLLAARILADAYDEVRVVERDSRRSSPVSPTISPRKSAVVCDGLADAVRVHEGHRYSRPPLVRRGLLVSRPLLESGVRRRVLALETVCVMPR